MVRKKHKNISIKQKPNPGSNNNGKGLVKKNRRKEEASLRLLMDSSSRWPRRLCSCVTASNVASYSDPSPWKNTPEIRFGNHSKGFPGYLEDLAREKKHPASSANSQAVKPSGCIRKTFPRKKPSAMVVYRFSHLNPEEYIISYRTSCSSVSQECLQESDKGLQATDDDPEHQIANYFPMDKKKSQMREINTITNDNGYTAPPTRKLLHELNLVVPCMAPAKQRNPPSELWYSSSSMAESIFHVQGNSTANSVSINPIAVPDCPPPTPAVPICNKKHKKSNKVFHGYYGEHLNNLQQYPVYGVLQSSDSATTIQDILRQKLYGNRRLFNSFATTNLKHHSLHKIDGSTTLEQGFRELHSQRSAEVSTPPGRLLSGRMRAKSDAGHIIDDSKDVTSTLQSTKLKAAVGNANKHTDKEGLVRTQSISTPNLLKVSTHQATHPPVFVHPSQNLQLMVGNRDLLRDSKLSVKPIIERPASEKVKYRISLEELAKKSKKRWRKDKSACFRRSSQRKSRRWLFLNDLGDLQEVSVDDPALILDNIVNAE